MSRRNVRLALLLALVAATMALVGYLVYGGPSPEQRVRRTLDGLVAAVRVAKDEPPERRLPRMHGALVAHLTPDATVVDEESLGTVNGRDAIESLVAQAPALGESVELSLSNVRVRIGRDANGTAIADVDGTAELRATNPERREQRTLHLHLRFDGEDGAPRIDRIEAKKPGG